MLEGPGLLDHPELVRAGVRLHGDPPGLVQDHHEQRGRGQQVRRPDYLPSTRPDRRGQRVRQVGAGQQGHGEHHEQHHGFGDGRERLGPARAELRVRAPGLQRGGGDDEAGQRQQESPAQDVTHVPQRQPVAGQHRDQQRDGQVRRHRDQRRGQEEPARPLRGQCLLAEQLGQVVVRLPDPRPPAPLQPRLHLGDHAGHRGRADRDRQHLQQLDKGYREGRAHRAAPRSLRASVSSMAMPPTLMSPTRG